MKVKDLIEQLKNYNSEAEIILYIWEDFDEIGDIMDKSKVIDEEEGLYCKGYSFDEAIKDDIAPYNADFIVLCGKN